MNIIYRVFPALLTAILILSIFSASYVYAINYMLYYKSIGILYNGSDDSIESFSSFLRMYNLIKSPPKVISQIASKKDVSNVDILIILSSAVDSLDDKSIEIIKNWFRQGGKLLIILLDKPSDSIDRCNSLLRSIGSRISISSNGGSGKIVTGVLNPMLSYLDDYHMDLSNISKVMYLDIGRFYVGGSIVGGRGGDGVYTVSYIRGSEPHALSVIESINVYSDLFTNVYSKVFISFENPLMTSWYKYDNYKLFIQVLSWGVSPHTTPNWNGLILIFTLIVLGISPYIYIYFRRG